MKFSLAKVASLYLSATALLPIVSSTPVPGTELIARAPIKRQTCLGDNGGTSIGVLVCCNIDFYYGWELVIQLSVKDSRGDSNDVYGWCVVEDIYGKFHQVPSSKLRNSQGKGTTIHQYNIAWNVNPPNKARYVSARACVDDAGTDTCGGSPRGVISPF
ncbi:hypothetical protein P154DRAFT_524161 [Amniculicola lignicola CBS 123094]|uniref:Uncharacterized protein n=1 Tax=Amniculicola lignicola CBS 123094 TaxID=1392246 RepID=A0A6A5WKM9_9PLEO|nr:hypothetical protein P154DRAFT_524161 [Amniculicola lignicola CBS 123094]